MLILIYNNIMGKKEKYVKIGTSLLLAITSLTLLAYSQQDRSKQIQLMGKTLTSTQRFETGLSPSHINSPGYEEVSFLYDCAVNALIYKALGDQENAEKIIDFFYKKYTFAKTQNTIPFDANNILGITKKIDTDNPEKPIYSLLNSIDISSTNESGSGILEYYTTPGPIAFLIMAMLQINIDKYIEFASALGDVLLFFQNNSGGITDGNRGADIVNTEPHMDACDVFLMLYDITGNEKWKKAYDKGISWFYSNVYEKDKGIIYQGITESMPSQIFATDGYSWTMASHEADNFSSEEIKMITENMLEKSLVKITFIKPNKSEQTAILIDFSTPEEFYISFVRKGFHPMGSIEWTAGVALALQKNAVRLFERKDMETAMFYKALAEELIDNCLSCFYKFNNGILSFYASAQNTPIAPFGYVKNVHKNNIRFSWKTPYFLAKDRAERISLIGGSPISFWIVFPIKGLNPFILNDNYKKIYDKIPLTENSQSQAKEYLDSATKDRLYSETPLYMKDVMEEILVEPRYYNMIMWEEINTGYELKEQGQISLAEEHFKKGLYWSYRTIHNKIWSKLAKRENRLKEEEFHGIIFYPWGKIGTDKNTDYSSIMKFPLLNEMGTAFFGAITCLFELGDKEKCKDLMKQLIMDFPLHQIPVANENKQTKQPEIIGFWNAIISWDQNPTWLEKNTQLQELFRSLVSENYKEKYAPEIIYISIPDNEEASYVIDEKLSKKYVLSPPKTISKEAPLSDKISPKVFPFRSTEAKLSNKYVDYNSEN
ncbi:MAG: AGE family epimerase/isomerase [Candidatus Omnitrophica bacterium]|nr:AGE family epimerase/isomerase [Candidatus Omnitrophota bacterium]